MKIAIIGSGITGLAAAWLLGEKHEVTVFEKEKIPGLDAHGIDFKLKNDYHFDVPFRTFKSNYYPNLIRLFGRADIGLRPIDFSTAFFTSQGETYFRYRNFSIRRNAIPLISPFVFFKKRPRRLLLDMIRFNSKAHELLAKEADPGVSIIHFLAKHGFSDDFANLFLIPLFAILNTCTHASARAYPARIIINYMVSGLSVNSILTAQNGTPDVVKKLSSRIKSFNMGQRLKKIKPSGQKIVIETGEKPLKFDHVIITAQAHQAVKLLAPQFAAEKKVLKKFYYENTEVVMHKNNLYMPGQKKYWSPVNFMVSESADKATGTIWLNRVVPELADEDTQVFQSVAPIKDIPGADIMSEKIFDRPVMNADTTKAIAELESLQLEKGRRLWLCGSYARDGMPLLEAGITTAARVVEKIDSSLGL